VAKVIITNALRNQVEQLFKAQSVNIFTLLQTLEQQPSKGKPVGNVSNVVVKEVKYKKFGFYCITDGHILKFGTTDELATLIIRFVRMSEKKDQQKIIEEIKHILRTLGVEGL